MIPRVFQGKMNYQSLPAPFKFKVANSFCFVPISVSPVQAAIPLSLKPKDWKRAIFRASGCGHGSRCVLFFPAPTLAWLHVEWLDASLRKPTQLAYASRVATLAGCVCQHHNGGNAPFRCIKLKLTYLYARSCWSVWRSVRRSAGNLYKIFCAPLRFSSVLSVAAHHQISKSSVQNRLCFEYKTLNPYTS